MNGNNIYLIIGCLYLAVLLPDMIRLLRAIRAPELKPNFSKLYFRFHLVLLLAGIVGFILLILVDINLFNYSRPIPYSEKSSITFSDFKGLNLTVDQVEGRTEFAFISSSIEYNIADNAVEIQSYFHPSRSYVYSPHLANEKVLNHELYHFAITEKWARKFRKEVRNLEGLPTRKLLSVSLRIIYDSLNREQAQYDLETNHSYLLGKQLEWQQRIDGEIEKLNTYSSTSIEF